MWRDVAAVADLAEGGAIAVAVDGDPILVARLSGRVLAAHGLCTHEDKPLAGGHPTGGTGWECPHHGARFDLATGRATQLPAVAPIETYPVRVEGGRVWVDV